MSNIKISPMTYEDIDDVLAISFLSFPISWSRESFLTELENNFSYYVVAKSDDVIVGFGGTWIIIDESHITNIAVHPSFRGLGIGELILKSLIDLGKPHFISSMTLEVRASNVVAISLYNKFDFKEEGRRKRYYEDNGEDALILWKRNF
ncbi:ribosomal protein S18-alanine N-acetyltransferase [Clostridium algidicarnis]|uniref:[Ribosomal protein bS18]-alanine N-acetyltransferase n=2 Tax=Clostridium algidicarnis TaxID=37659 RepID=A0A2S6FZF8_9CLOT|nr:ribosomal protein S18-alanine N-acetyltransferase [Clostridium algidicarnis]MBB6630975.1 ribosomal protein S18-alanine N-acetyltransferase [Clostridium algidicarnis]MBB6698616.1 ribosomal protein S18-alanine N-acetyltransferase [Clostridium algidicarnis]MBU3203748.1 ribosomal protein S18-alanine N-acetyltransferase [Clostridium algidicarnis]MBU3205985.1 ribosomal protein S18-alanine N-acetyltransferase [Clostridium algidicarnis]MBU3211902.1 ribosomal protein S18-alanine N-acetyltransferase 